MSSIAHGKNRQRKRIRRVVKKEMEK